MSAAILGLSVLLTTGVVTWKECLGESVAWDTLTWFAALIAMAGYLNKYGLIAWFSQKVVKVRVLQVRRVVPGGLGCVGQDGCYAFGRLECIISVCTRCPGTPCDGLVVSDYCGRSLEDWDWHGKHHSVFW